MKYLTDMSFIQPIKCLLFFYTCQQNNRYRNPISRNIIMFIITRRLFKNFYLTICRRETTIVKNKHDVHEQWEKKMKVYMKTYEDLFGITKLSEMHDKVIEIQTNLQSVQEKRRNVQGEIFTVQKKLQEMQDILHKTSMGDDMYISVVTQVRELLKEQKRLQDIFSMYDQTEREQQTLLAVAINSSQDHERTYREKNKYLSLISGVVGGLLGLLGSSINNWRHRRDIKHFASDINDQVVDLKKSVDKLKVAVSSDKVLQDAASNSSDETGNILSDIKSHCSTLEENIRSLQSMVNDSYVNKNSNQSNPSNGHIEIVFEEFEKNFTSKLNNHLYANLGLIGSYTLFFTLFILYVTKYS